MTRLEQTKVPIVESWFEGIKPLEGSSKLQNGFTQSVVIEERKMKTYEFTKMLESLSEPRTLFVEPSNSHLVVNSLPSCASFLDMGTINERTSALFNFESGVKRHMRAKGSSWRYLTLPQVDQCFVPDSDSARYAEAVCKGGGKENLKIIKYSIK